MFPKLEEPVVQFFPTRPGCLLSLPRVPLQSEDLTFASFPLADRVFQIRDMMGNKPHLQAFCEIRNSYRSNTNVLGIWESNIPIYYLPLVNVLPDFIHSCCANYEPTKRAVIAPSGIVLFYITPQSINEMLNFKLTQPLAPLTMKFLLDQAAKLPSSAITKISQLFMRPESQPMHPPPFNQFWFNEAGILITDMISYIWASKPVSILIRLS